mgnify:CR=1 FL=1|jgi:hypothetical protein
MCRICRLVVFVSVLILNVLPAENKTKNLILVTMDGLRWQELFHGADSLLISDPDFVQNSDQLRKQFWGKTPALRRQKLMPFFWGTISSSGQLYGNQTEGSAVLLTNNQWFSYPGYNEILTGYADPEIDSNDKKWNRNVTFLEYLNRQRGFERRVAAFCSWDVFPYIINTERSGIPVSAGEGGAIGDRLSDREALLNQLIAEMPIPFSTVRWDAFTFRLTMEYLAKERPKVIYIAFDATDDYAHQGKYDRYLTAANRQDQFIAELWEWLQSHAFYRNKTSMMITTDHGRGDHDKWTSHGRSIDGADRVWLAVIGPDTPAGGEMKNHPSIFSNQIAATATTLLNVRYVSRQPVGGIIERIIAK